MGKVISSASMSLDGFVADEHDQVGPLFDWFGNGSVHIDSGLPSVSFDLTPQSADYWRRWTSAVGALVVGRRLFDITDGWGGHHPLGVPVVVVTHEAPVDWGPPGAELEFVTDGVAAGVARAREIAGEANVGVAAGTIARQCVELDLLDEVAIDLVPVFLGAGKPYLGPAGPVLLGNPLEMVQGDRVTHLRYGIHR